MSKAASLRTPEQNRRMRGLAAELSHRSGISTSDAEDVLHRLCHECSGQEHTSLLTEGQAARVIAKMKAEIAGYVKAPVPPGPTQREPWGDRGPGPRGDRRISPRQQEVLLALFDQAGMGSREQQMGFCKRQTGVPWPQTQAHADALQEPLKAMILRRVKPEEFRARVDALVGNSGLDAWKANFVADLQRQIQDAVSAGKGIGRVLTTHKLLKLIECELAAEA